MEKIITSPTNYPLIFKVINENAWMPPHFNDGKATEIEMWEMPQIPNLVATMNKVEEQLEKLTPVQLRVFMGWFPENVKIATDKDQEEFNKVAAEIDAEFPLLGKFFNYQQNFGDFE